MANKKLIVGIVILLVVMIFANQEPTDTQSVATIQSVTDYGVLSSCEQARSSRIDDGYLCVTDCVEITQPLIDCLDGYKEDRLDVGNYGYFYAPFRRTCAESDTRRVTYNDVSYSYEDIRLCMEGKTPSIQCIDSDGGKIYSVKGTTSREDETFTDYCDGNDLWEFYCDVSGFPAGEQSTCDGDCYNGACDEVLVWCLSSDKKSCNQRSSCISGETEHVTIDWCRYYSIECESTSECANDKVCKNNKCVSDYECSINSECPGEEVCKDNKCFAGAPISGGICENFWEDEDNGCKVYDWIIWVGVAFGAMIVLSVTVKKK